MNKTREIVIQVWQLVSCIQFNDQLGDGSLGNALRLFSAGLLPK